MGNGSRQDVRSFLPMPAPAFYVVAVLAEGPMHAYGVLKAVEAHSSGRVRFSASTFYDVVRRLEEQGLIAETERRPIVPLDDPRRKYFELTGLGRAVGEAEARRLEEALGLARASRLVTSPGGQSEAT